MFPRGFWKNKNQQFFDFDFFFIDFFNLNFHWFKLVLRGKESQYVESYLSQKKGQTKKNNHTH